MSELELLKKGDNLHGPLPAGEVHDLPRRNGQYFLFISNANFWPEKIIGQITGHSSGTHLTDCLCWNRSTNNWETCNKDFVYDTWKTFSTTPFPTPRPRPSAPPTYLPPSSSVKVNKDKLEGDLDNFWVVPSSMVTVGKKYRVGFLAGSNGAIREAIAKVDEIVTLSNSTKSYRMTASSAVHYSSLVWEQRTVPVHLDVKETDVVLYTDDSIPYSRASTEMMYATIKDLIRRSSWNELKKLLGSSGLRPNIDLNKPIVLSGTTYSIIEKIIASKDIELIKGALQYDVDLNIKASTGQSLLQYTYTTYKDALPLIQAKIKESANLLEAEERAYKQVTSTFSQHQRNLNALEAKSRTNVSTRKTANEEAEAAHTQRLKEELERRRATKKTMRNANLQALRTKHAANLQPRNSELATIASNRSTMASTAATELKTTLATLDALHERVLEKKKAEIQAMAQGMNTQIREAEQVEKDIDALEQQLNRNTRSGNLRGYNNKVPALTRQLEETNTRIATLRATMANLDQTHTILLTQAKTVEAGLQAEATKKVSFESQYQAGLARKQELDAQEKTYEEKMKALSQTTRELKGTRDLMIQKLQVGLQAQEKENQGKEEAIQQATKELVARLQSGQEEMRRTHEQAMSSLKTTQDETIGGTNKSHQTTVSTKRKEGVVLIAQHKKELLTLDQICTEEKAERTRQKEELERVQTELNGTIATLNMNIEELKAENNVLVDQFATQQYTTNSFRSGFIDTRLKELRTKAIQNKPHSGSSRRRSRRHKQ